MRPALALGLLQIMARVVVGCAQLPKCAGALRSWGLGELESCLQAPTGRLNSSRGQRLKFAATRIMAIRFAATRFTVTRTPWPIKAIELPGVY